MKAFMPVVPPHILEWRKRTGAHYWDEMWEGVIHMPPLRNRQHQDLQMDMVEWLRRFWARPRGNRVHHEVNVASVGGWPDDYRVPDLVLLMPDRFQIDHNEYFEGPPTVVVEIRSPGDESFEKLPFYAKLGVPEVWIIDRDTRVPQLFLLSADAYDEQSADASGWLRSPATGVWLRAEAGNRLGIRMAVDPSALRLLPE